MYRKTLAGIGVVAALSLAPLPLLAGDGSPPARMLSCSILPQTIERRGTAPAETIRVSFMITGDIPADRVRFIAIAPAEGFHQFTARGYFTKSVMILGRELEPDAGVAVKELPHGVECALTYIHYVDGSSWNAPEP